MEIVVFIASIQLFLWFALIQEECSFGETVIIQVNNKWNGGINKLSSVVNWRIWIVLEGNDLSRHQMSIDWLFSYIQIMESTTR